MSHFAFSDCPAFLPREVGTNCSTNARTTSIVSVLNMGRVKARQVKESTIESTIAKAIEEYKSGSKTSIRQAAESQGLAYSTLYGRLKGRLPRRKAHELDQTLGEAEERAIVRQIEDMDRRGFPMRVDHVREMGLRLLSEREGQSREKVYLGKHWVSRFLDRNPHLTSKFSTQVQKQRIVSSNPKILKQSFEVLGPLIKKNSIQPHNIYNMDEKGLQMGKSARVKVICVRGRKSPPLMKDGNRELITAIETIAADGSFLPPMIIYKGQGQLAQWHNYLKAEDSQTVFSVSPKGWTNQVLGVEYLRLLFDPLTRLR